MRPRKIRLPTIYDVCYVTRLPDGPRDRLCFTVRAWNKLDASLDGHRQLLATGANPDEWWAIGPMRRV